MTYNQPQKGQWRTPNYRGTVKTLFDYDLAALKANVKEYNRYFADVAKRFDRPRDFYPSMRVRVMARGPRQAVKADVRAEGMFGRVEQYLPVQYGEYWDVYVHETKGKR